MTATGDGRPQRPIDHIIRDAPRSNPRRPRARHPGLILRNTAVIRPEGLTSPLTHTPTSRRPQCTTPQPRLGLSRSSATSGHRVPDQCPAVSAMPSIKYCPSPGKPVMVGRLGAVANEHRWAENRGTPPMQCAVSYSAKLDQLVPIPRCWAKRLRAPDL